MVWGWGFLESFIKGTTPKSCTPYFDHSQTNLLKNVIYRKHLQN